MKFRMVMSAFFKFKNLGWMCLLLAASAIAANMLSGLDVFGLSVLIDPTTPVVYLPALVIYLGIIAKTLLSEEFHEEFNRREKRREIQDLNYKCLKLANEAKRHTNAAYMKKLRRVMDDKKDIVESYFRGEHSYIKEKIVEQTLNLIVAYIKLLINFCIRSKELGEMDVSTIADRINANVRKLNFANDPHIKEDVKNLIEMDEKIINRLKDEKKELERISAKLDYMESTVNMFKHQAISSIESEEMVEKLQTAVDEAKALDNVLEERRRNKINL
ncbi:hypothetical protein DFR58_11257 [Anaerobacterium chartisolvens]|uniref:5-bromo-4-chloroindolyl phosphate hydrolysis protein n=1 Tax=Anaerobacterium chartisolvens TaxID=1297424 RepID=A0A369B435_9FIRM|nr:hypothetical protein [Anaerobacterium chartisolvens]RCX16075.1 hypothetical protein DFR58_11257 [Anaerobacterium chartisolvens]